MQYGTSLSYLKLCRRVSEGTEETHIKSLASCLLQLVLKYHQAISMGLLQTDRHTCVFENDFSKRILVGRYLLRILEKKHFLN